MIKFFHKIKSRLVIKNTLTLVLGVGIAQIIAIVFQLITRRLYTPEDFGAYAVYYSFVSILVSIVSLQYSKAIVLPRFKFQSNNLLIGTILIIFVFSVFIFATIIVFPSVWIKLINFPQKYIHWIYFLPFTVFLLASYETLNYWLIRAKAFNASAYNKIIRRTGEGATQVGIGFTGNSFGILLGDLIGNLVNLLSGIYQIRKHGFRSSDIRYSNIKYILKKYSDFPKYNAVPNLINTISLFFPVLIVNKLYSHSVVGYFDLSRMVLAVPLALITTSLSQVLLQNFSEKRNNNQGLMKPVFKISGLLSLLVLFGIIITEFFAKDIFRIFGSQYIISGIYTKILVFSYGIKFIVSPLSVLFISLERLKISALWQIAYFCLLTSLFLFRDLEIFDFLKILVAIDLVSYSIYYVLIVMVSKQFDYSLKINKP